MITIECSTDTDGGYVDPELKEKLDNIFNEAVRDAISRMWYGPYGGDSSRGTMVHGYIADDADYLSDSIFEACGTRREEDLEKNRLEKKDYTFIDIN